MLRLLKLEIRKHSKRWEKCIWVNLWASVL